MSAKYDFDRLIDRKGTDSLKWCRYAGTDVLPMWVADMDFAAPPEVIEAIHRRADHGIFGYAVAPQELVESVVAMLAEAYGWRVKPDWIVWLPGLVCGLNLVCRTVGAPGDHVLTTLPVYPPFLSAPKLSDRRLVTAELVRQRRRWTFDFDALEKAITSRTRLLILCNPHNPTGRIYSKKELGRLLEICRRHDIIVCADEIHCQLVLDARKRHHPFASLGKTFEERTITLMAPSKTYNIPGLSCSFAVIADEKLRRRFITRKIGIVPEVNVMGYAAAWAAYREGGPWLAALLKYLRGNRDLVTEAVGHMPGLAMDPVEATYLAWIDARQTGLKNPTAFFESAGVGLSDGKDFGAQGFLRLNFGCPRKRLLAALERMQKALEKRSRSIL